MCVYSIYIRKKGPVFYQNRPFVAKLLQAYYNMPNIVSNTDRPSSMWALSIMSAGLNRMV